MHNENNINICTLADLKPGNTAVVSELKSDGSIRRRLQDIGLIPGTMVECIQKSPLGDPTAYCIRGTVMALRCEDSSRVLILPLSPASRTAKRRT